MAIFSTIFCATDLSPECDGALADAAALAGDDATRLVALHCLGGPDEPAALEPSILDRLAVAAGDRRWEGLVATGAGVAETIVREAAVAGADLVVLRSRRSTTAPALIGSTVDAVCRTAPCPVLVTRASGGVAPRAPRSVLVAYDFWDDAELALRNGLAIAERHRAELHVLHVVPAPLRWAADADLERLIPVVERRLAGAVPDSVRRRARVATHVRVGSPYREILSFAEELGVDLVCVGARGRDFGARSLFGSNSDRILRQAACPVLIARPLRPAIALGGATEGAFVGLTTGGVAR